MEQYKKLMEEALAAREETQKRAAEEEKILSEMDILWDSLTKEQQAELKVFYEYSDEDN